MYYVSGFAGERDRHLALLLTADGTRTFVAPESHVGQVRDASWIDDVHAVPRNAPGDVAAGLGDVVPDSTARVRVDDAMPTGVAHRLEAELPAATFRLANELLLPLRLRKDEAERRALRRAAAKTDAVSAEIRALGDAAVGTTEAELAVEIRARLHERGATQVAFPVVVAAGPNGARPGQYRHGDRPIREGEPVVVDFGGFFGHYASDQTRTVVFGGDPPAGFPRAHDAVRDALEAGVAAAEPGVTAAELDRAVRDVVAERGFADEFVTDTGHGVGVEAHEPPTIGAGDDTTLAPGMTFSIEPGIYFEGDYGVRLETVVVLGEDGAEPLNTSPYTWGPLD